MDRMMGAHKNGNCVNIDEDHECLFAYPNACSNRANIQFALVLRHRLNDPPAQAPEPHIPHRSTFYNSLSIRKCSVYYPEIDYKECLATTKAVKEDAVFGSSPLFQRPFCCSVRLR